MDPKVSIIVPIYKVEPYIHRCINSILNQTYKDFELILVDDGSPDRCGEICDDYAVNDTRIKVIHKKNGGVSSARNFGLQTASGKYVMFVDSDDWIEPSALKTLSDNIDKYNSDVFIFGLVKDIYSGNDLIKSQYNGFYKNKNVHVKEFSNNIVYYLNTVGMHPSWMFLFKRTIISEYHLEFNCNLVLYEDFDFNIRFLRHSNTITFISEALYHYNLSTSVDQLEKRNKIDIVPDISGVCNSLMDFMRVTNTKNESKQQIYTQILPMYTLCMRNIIIHRKKTTLIQKIKLLEQINSDEIFKLLINNYANKFKYYRVFNQLINKKFHLLAYYLLLIKFR